MGAIFLTFPPIPTQKSRFDHCRLLFFRPKRSETTPTSGDSRDMFLFFLFRPVPPLTLIWGEFHKTYIITLMQFIFSEIYNITFLHLIFFYF